jgi:hypothetical protein
MSSILTASLADQRGGNGNAPSWGEAGETIMTLPEAAPQPDASWLDDYPRDHLEAMLEAGREALEWRRILQKSGDNLVGVVLKNQGTFTVLDHYPKGDVYDPESHSQWYYHAHDKRERPGEHGHFHTFMRGRGMAEGVEPAPLPDYQPKDDPHDLICHLIAVSMDSSGWPIGLFTTNRWVTGETWYAAHDVCSMLDGFDMKMDKPTWSVNRWLTCVLRLFQPQIIDLLMERDEKILQWKLQHQDRNVYEDRELEVASKLAISVEGQVALLEARLAA